MIDQICFSSKKNMCAPGTQKTKKITHFLLLKAHPISIIGAVLHYEQLCRAANSTNDGIFL